MFQIARAGRGRKFSFRPGLACPGGLVAYPRGAPTRQWICAPGVPKDKREGDNAAAPKEWNKGAYPCSSHGVFDGAALGI